MTDWNYRGWSIDVDPKPIPCRVFDWTGTHPNYDASYEGEEDGWVGSGGCEQAATYEDLCAAIDQWEAIAAEDEAEAGAANGQFGVGS